MANRNNNHNVHRVYSRDKLDVYKRIQREWSCKEGKTKKEYKNEFNGYGAPTNHYANNHIVDTINGYDMNGIDKIKNRIQGLQALLTMSIRIGEAEYTRSIRNTIMECERELKIQRVQQARINENWD